ncbi:MAG TPA: HAD family phosphatase [Steroidobacteraceae bacterium]|jgi:HAD superfamily hydrolase (TIGR01509 family)|nr:HAD family phosphatase [Steroidobacteraceae bacterium]
MRYHGIVFDFNGVLFSDSDLQEQSWQVVARKLRGREMTSEEFALHMHGRANAYVLSYLAGRDITGRELTDWIEVKESLFRRLCLETPNRLVLSAGAQDLLESLRLAGVPRTIATSSGITNVNFYIQYLHIDRWFDVAKLVYDDGVLSGKPAPDMYLAAARNIGLDPSRCVVVEDAVSGVAAAQAAKIGYIVGIGASASHASLLKSKGAALVIETLQAFPRERLLDYTLQQ